MSNVNDNQKGGPAFIQRQGAGILFGLSLGFDHGQIPPLGTAYGGASFGGLPSNTLLVDSQRRFLAGLITSLLCLTDKMPLLVEINPAIAGATIAMAEGDAALEDIGIVPVIRTRRFWSRDIQEFAQL